MTHVRAVPGRMTFSFPGVECLAPSAATRDNQVTTSRAGSSHLPGVTLSFSIQGAGQKTKVMHLHGAPQAGLINGLLDT